MPQPGFCTRRTPAYHVNCRTLEERLRAAVDRLPRGMRLTGGGQCSWTMPSAIFGLDEAADAAAIREVPISKAVSSRSAQATLSHVSYFQRSSRPSYRYPKVSLKLGVARTPKRSSRVSSIPVRKNSGIRRGRIRDEVSRRREFRAIALSPWWRRNIHSRRCGPRRCDRCESPSILREPGSGHAKIVERGLVRHRLTLRCGLPNHNAEALKRGAMEGAASAGSPNSVSVEEASSGRLVA